MINTMTPNASWITEVEGSSNRARWGGLVVAIGSTLILIGILVLLPSPFASAGFPYPVAPTLDRAQASASNSFLLPLGGSILVLGDVITATGSFMLLTRPLSRLQGASSAGWALTAVSVILFAAADSFTARMAVPLAQSYSQSPSIFSAFVSEYDFVFGVASLIGGIGEIAIFWTEARIDSPAIPRRLSYVGIIGAIFFLLASIGFLSGSQLSLFGPIGIALPLVVAVVLGARLWVGKGVAK